MRNQRDKRNYIIIGLCAILVIMGVGYASFSTLLTINGTANISNSWCLGFDNTKTNTMQVTKGVSTGANPTGSMSYSGTACSTTLQPNASLSATFHQPGDEIEYTLTIKNASTVTAAIKSILVDNESVTSNTTRTKDNIIYVINMPLDTTLSPNEETTMTIIAKFQNETPIGSGYAGETKSINVKINAEQDDGNGGFTPVPDSFTGTIYRWSRKALANKGSSSASTNPYTIANLTKDTDYITETDYPTFNARLIALNKRTDKYYLKHDIVNDEIINSYVCFIYNNAEHCMKGGDGGASYSTNRQIITDYQNFYNLEDIDDLPGNPDDDYCDIYSSLAECLGGYFSIVRARPNGSVYVNHSDDYCIVSNSGFTQCHMDND